MSTAALRPTSPFITPMTRPRDIGKRFTSDTSTAVMKNDCPLAPTQRKSAIAHSGGGGIDPDTDKNAIRYPPLTWHAPSRNTAHTGQMSKSSPDMIPTLSPSSLKNPTVSNVSWS